MENFTVISDLAQSGISLAMLVVLVQLKTEMRHAWRAIRKLEQTK